MKTLPHGWFRMGDRIIVGAIHYCAYCGREIGMMAIDMSREEAAKIAEFDLAFFDTPQDECEQPGCIQARQEA